MSDPGPHSADPALATAVRPFRRAAFELNAPVAGLEAALGALGAFTAALEPALGRLDISPFASFGVGEAGPAAAAATGEASPGGRGPRRAPAAKRPGRTPAPRSSPPAGGGLEGMARALRGLERDVAVAGAAERVVPGTGAAAVGIARSVEGLTSLPLVGELAQAALDAVAAPAAPGSGGRAGAVAGAAAGARSTSGRAPAAPAGGGDGGFGSGVARALEELERDLMVASVAEAAVPGSSRVAVPVARGARAAVSLLEQLADTTLAVVAPAAPAPASGREERRRPDASEAVRRELDATATRGEGTAHGALARDAVPAATAGASPEPVDVAWLVNEALVEQARRHGVDLS